MEIKPPSVGPADTGDPWKLTGEFLLDEIPEELTTKQS
jgi:hypothetical protein